MRLDRELRCEVQRSNYDAANPWAVVIIKGRTFNRVVARYATEAQAKRRARDWNKAHGT